MNICRSLKDNEYSIIRSLTFIGLDFAMHNTYSKAFLNFPVVVMQVGPLCLHFQ
jgi:hypothetical protein